MTFFRGLFLLAAIPTALAADTPREPPGDLVRFISATQAAGAVIRACPDIDWDQQGYIWASERTWRLMDAEGISRVHFRDQIRPLSEAELTSETRAFQMRHGLADTAPVCDAARVEAALDTPLGSLIQVAR